MWWTVPADDGDRQDVSISSSRTYIRSLRIVVLLLPLFISFFLVTAAVTDDHYI